MTARIYSVEWAPLDQGASSGIRAAMIDSVNTVVLAFEEGEGWDPVVPPAVAVQIRYMAGQGASLEEILRGFTLVGNVFFEFFVEKLGQFPQNEDTLRYLSHWQHFYFERLVNAFAAVYTSEIERLNSSSSRELLESVKNLLAGGARRSYPVELPTRRLASRRDSHGL